MKKVPLKNRTNELAEFVSKLLCGNTLETIPFDEGIRIG